MKHHRLNPRRYQRDRRRFMNKRKYKKRQRWVARVFLFETDVPFIWITEEDADSICKHLPGIGSDFGDGTVRAFDYGPI